MKLQLIVTVDVEPGGGYGLRRVADDVREAIQSALSDSYSNGLDDYFYASTLNARPEVRLA